MIDVRVIYVRDAIPVRRFTLISDDPPVVRIVGGNFTSADVVYVNQREVREFVVVAPTAIEFTIPEELRSERIRTVDVMSASDVVTTTSILEPRVGNMPIWVKGIQRLVQRFTKVLLQNPGTSLMRPSEGGGLRKAAAVVNSSAGLRAASAEALGAIQRTASQIRADQYRRQVPKNERLRAATVRSIDADRHAGGITIRVALENEAGEFAATSFGVGVKPTAV